MSEADLKAQRRREAAAAEKAANEANLAFACGLSDAEFRDVLRFREAGDPLGAGGHIPNQPRYKLLADAKISCSSGSSGGGGGSKAQHAEAQHFLQLHQQQLQRQQQMLEAQLKQSNSVAVSFMAVHNEEDLDVQIPDDVEPRGSCGTATTRWCAQRGMARSSATTPCRRRAAEADLQQHD